MGYIFESEIELIMNAVRARTIGEAESIRLRDILNADLHPALKAYFRARIWQLLQKPIAVRQVLDKLLEEYDVDPETAQRDLLEIVEQLMAAGLVERSDASAT